MEGKNLSKTRKPGWRVTTLRECGRWYSGGTPSLDHGEFWRGEIPWISAKSMNSLWLSDSEDRVTRLGALNGTRVVPRNTILILVRGSGLLKRIPIGISATDVAFNQDVKAIVPHDSVVPEFLLYWLLSKEKTLLNMVEFTGIGAGKLDTESLMNLEIRLPSVSEQRQMIGLPLAIDNKLRLVKDMGRNLESIASTIFKSWFVDFDPVRAKAEGKKPFGMDHETAALFPDSFEDSELGEIPKGWAVKSLSSVITIIGGGTPRTSVREYWDGEIPWFSVEDVPGESEVFVLDTERHISPKALEYSSTKMLDEGSTIVTARGTVGKLAIAGVPMAMNQSCYAVKGLNGHLDFFVYYTLKLRIQDLMQHSYGTVFDTITTRTFDEVMIPVPPLTVAREFDLRVSPFMMMLKNSLQQSRTLATLRDTLLLRLLSGEIQLPQGTFAEGLGPEVGLK